MSSRTTPNPSLPGDLILSCLARVSRLYYPTLSLVSKSFRSLLASPELYKARSLLGRIDICLYVCVGYGSDFRWFTLCRRPDRIWPVLAKVPVPSSRRAKFSSIVAVGSNIYNIGESCDFKSDSASSSVSILDCTFHTWREGPNLPVGLTSLSASVIDRKIYVVGSGPLRSLDKKSFHVFDTTTQIWDPEPIPCPEANDDFFAYPKSACVDGKFHVIKTRREFTYNPMEGRWDVVEQGIRDYLSSYAYCDIGNVLYCVWRGRFMWYDTEVCSWRNLNGLEELEKWRFLCVRLVDYGGKMAVFFIDNKSFWENGNMKRYVWCALIELEKRNSCEVWGNVEWLDHVLQIPYKYDLVKVFTVTV